jgi:gamma-glutamyl hercynylcysteine S-oxide synthase
MIAWVHSFRKWTWLTFAIGFAAASWGLRSGDDNRLLVGSGATAMIGVALLVEARRWRHRKRRAVACDGAAPDDCNSQDRTAVPTQARGYGAHPLPDEFDLRGRTDGPPDSGGQPPSPPLGSPGCRVQEFVDTLMSEGRYALLLRPQVAGNLSSNLLTLARQRLERQMTLVPEGDVLVEPHLIAGEPINEAEATAAQGAVVHVAAAFLDRHTVTNRQFQVFVTAGGYDQMAIWDPSIWPAVLNFVDGTGHPGPRYWQHGRFPPGKADHPVVGVSWYEAAAYARWVGKRLPTDAEWLKAGCWPVQLSPESRMQRKFPWGNGMDRDRANLWGSGPGDTMPVDDFATGISVGGIGQLIGNVWEWTAADFELPVQGANRRDANGIIASEFAADRAGAIQPTPLKALRGGAFDTYFDHQAACQFASGDSPLARKYNIGFRLALGTCDLVPATDVEPELLPESEAERPAPIEEMLQPV